MPGIKTATIENQDEEVVAVVTIIGFGKVLITVTPRLLPNFLERMTDIKEMYPHSVIETGVRETLTILVSRTYNENSVFPDLQTHIRSWIRETEKI